MACTNDCCSVCGASIDKENPQFTSQYQAEQYCFCCQNCKSQFDANPAAYAGQYVTTA
ncbi:MAG TPA: YHS domain-containing protein [Chthonomonadales bacterium]|nr:YHS domain-containing protein [Chthonomonadales bacterium]